MTSTTGAPVALSGASCEFVSGAFGTWSASAEPGGPLRVGTTISANGMFREVGTRSFASFTDRLTFSGLVPTFVEFTLRDRGAMSIATATGSGGFQSGINTLGVNTCTSTFSQTRIGEFGFVLEGTNAQILFFGTGDVDLTRTLRCAVDPAGFIEFRYAISATSSLYSGTGSAALISGSYFANFMNTSEISGLRFLDARGEALTTGVGFRAESGSNYRDLSVAVPEPDTLPLLVLAIVLFVASGHRARRTSRLRE